MGLEGERAQQLRRHSLGQAIRPIEANGIFHRPKEAFGSAVRNRYLGDRHVAQSLELRTRNLQCLLCFAWQSPQEKYEKNKPQSAMPHVFRLPSKGDPL